MLGIGVTFRVVEFSMQDSRSDCIGSVMEFWNLIPNLKPTDWLLHVTHRYDKQLYIDQPALTWCKNWQNKALNVISLFSVLLEMKLIWNLVLIQEYLPSMLSHKKSQDDWSLDNWWPLENWKIYKHQFCFLIKLITWLLLIIFLRVLAASSISWTVLLLLVAYHQQPHYGYYSQAHIW